IWESLLTGVLVRVEDAARPKRAMVQFFLRLAQDIERKRLAGQTASLWQRLLYPLGSLFVYGPLKDNLGLSRVRRAYTAGEAIGPEIFLFFRGLGVNVKQLYGMTEASVFVTIQRDGDVRLDTVGNAAHRRRHSHLGERRGLVPEPGRLPRLREEPGGDQP